MKLFLTKGLLLLSSVLLLNSCKKEKLVFRAKPQILVSGGGTLAVINGIADAAIVADTTLRLVYTVSAEESIKSLTQTVKGVAKDIPDAVGKKVYTVNVDVPVSLTNAGAVKVTMFVTDNNGLIRLEENLVTVRLRVALTPPKNLKLYSDILIGGYNADPPSRMDLDLGNRVSGGSVSPVTIPLIDLAFNEGVFMNNDGSGRWPSGMGSMFATTNITELQFNNMSTDITIQSLSISKVANLDIKPLVGKVIYFETNLGNKGVLFVKKYDTGKDEIVFDYKVTQ